MLLAWGYIVRKATPMSQSFEQVDAFTSGFKIGTTLMCAVFMSDGEPTSCE